MCESSTWLKAFLVEDWCLKSSIFTLIKQLDRRLLPKFQHGKTSAIQGKYAKSYMPETLIGSTEKGICL